jgi:hypothetical protein
MITVIALIVVGVCLAASIVGNFALYKAANLQLQKAELYESWIEEFKQDMMQTFAYIKLIDDRNIFSKDDEVGVVFQDMVNVIGKLNERTQEAEPTEGE